MACMDGKVTPSNSPVSARTSTRQEKEDLAAGGVSAVKRHVPRMPPP